MTGTENGKALPLCVDLDGTLLLGDMLYESVLKLLSRNPLYVFALPFWLLGGPTQLYIIDSSQTVIGRGIVAPPDINLNAQSARPFKAYIGARSIGKADLFAYSPLGACVGRLSSVTIGHQ